VHELHFSTTGFFAQCTEWTCLYFVLEDTDTFSSTDDSAAGIVEREYTWLESIGMKALTYRRSIWVLLSRVNVFVYQQYIQQMLAKPTRLPLLTGSAEEIIRKRMKLLQTS
jgi:hypothetical protein